MYIIDKYNGKTFNKIKTTQCYMTDSLLTYDITTERCLYFQVDRPAHDDHVAGAGESTWVREGRLTGRDEAPPRVHRQQVRP
jgi:hypothetical protein